MFKNTGNKFKQLISSYLFCSPQKYCKNCTKNVDNLFDQMKRIEKILYLLVYDRGIYIHIRFISLVVSMSSVSGAVSGYKLQHRLLLTAGCHCTSYNNLYQGRTICYIRSMGVYLITLKCQ